MDVINGFSSSEYKTSLILSPEEHVSLALHQNADNRLEDCVQGINAVSGLAHLLSYRGTSADIKRPEAVRIAKSMVRHIIDLDCRCGLDQGYRFGSTAADQP